MIKNELQKFTCLLIFLLNMPLFAAEITFVPKAGFSLYSVHSYEQKNLEAPAVSEISKNKATYLLPTPSVGLDMSFTNEKNGFTFTLANNFNFPIKLYTDGGFGSRNENISGVIWDGQAILGYTYGVRQKIQFTIGVGLGCSLGLLNTGTAKNNAPPYYNIGLALNFGYRYYFSEKIGITLGVHDQIGFSGIFLDRGIPSISGESNKTKLDGMLGFGNIFSFEIGVAFRL